MRSKREIGALLNAMLDAHEASDRAAFLDAWHEASEAVDTLRTERNTYREHWDAYWGQHSPGTPVKVRNARVTASNRAVLAMLNHPTERS